MHMLNTGHNSKKLVKISSVFLGYSAASVLVQPELLSFT